MEEYGTPAAPAQGAPGEFDVVGEARWPMACAVLAAIALTLLLPDDLRLGSNWVLPLLEGVLLVTLIVAIQARSPDALGSCARSGSHLSPCSA